VTGLGGEHFWAGARHRGAGEPFGAVVAATGATLEPIYRDATPGEVDAAVQAAAAAAAPFAAQPPAVRAQLLRNISDELGKLGDPLIECAGTETALPPARLQMERQRTMNQLRLFADLVDEGSWIDARIDRAQPDREPVPKPDLRAMLVPLGPVAVFGASNFPLAYSVAGGDTASALAAGCPVVVKGHPAHPGTSELVAGAVVRAAAAAGVPDGVFGMVHGRSHQPGRSLVEHPGITAVGFTGSASGGQALVRLAAARPRPIPVFAEMGSVNPVFVLPGAMAERSAAIAQALAASVTLGTGQFCTCPGLVLHDDSAAGASFLGELTDRLGATAAGLMVHPQLAENYRSAIGQVQGLSGVALRATGRGQEAAAPAAAARLFATDVATVLDRDRLREEVFGPAIVAVRYRSPDELLDLARCLDGHLTATVHGSDADLRQHAELVSLLQSKVGRLLFGGVPTGVEVCPAMQHGGPWPASSDSRFTAVGPRAVLRWARPVCLQEAPAGLLPAALQDHNPMGLWRTVDGVLDRH